MMMMPYNFAMPLITEFFQLAKNYQKMAERSTTRGPQIFNSQFPDTAGFMLRCKPASGVSVALTAG
jgi:hypothetical protein